MESPPASPCNTSLSLGATRSVAINAPTALRVLEQCPIAAIVVEYRHEGIDAEAVAFQIKQRFPQQLIILLSAYSDMPERVLWLMDDYVMMSEPLETVAKVIERAIDANRKSVHHPNILQQAG